MSMAGVRLRVLARRHANFRIAKKKNGHVISQRQRDVNRPPEQRQSGGTHAKRIAASFAISTCLTSSDASFSG